MRWNNNGRIANRPELINRNGERSCRGRRTRNKGISYACFFDLVWAFFRVIYVRRFRVSAAFFDLMKRVSFMFSDQYEIYDRVWSITAYEQFRILNTN